MERTKENAWCCGAGAGVKKSFPELALFAAGNRIDEAEATGADALVSSCPNCLRNLKDAARKSESKLEILDLVELVGMAV